MKSDEEIEVMHAGDWLRLRRAGKWEWVDRPNTTGVVALYAFTDAGEVILVEQRRRPLDSAVVLEVPAGLVGDIEGEEDEELSVAARRELIEETGYRAGQLTEVTAMPSSAGMSSEVVTCYVARGLVKVGEGGGDASEDITVHLVPLSEFRAFVRGRMESGTWVDPKVLAVPFFAAW